MTLGRLHSLLGGVESWSLLSGAKGWTGQCSAGHRERAQSRQPHLLPLVPPTTDGSCFSPGQISLVVFIGLLFTRFWFFSILYSIWWYLDRDKPQQGGRCSKALQSWVMWKHMRDHFPISVSTGAGCGVARARGVHISVGKHGHLWGCGANMRNEECTGFEGLCGAYSLAHICILAV